MTFDEVLRARANDQPDQLAYVFLRDGRFDEQQWTFADLDRRARAIGAVLQEHAARGERALLLYPQSLEFLGGFFGCLYSGVIGVPAPAPEASRLKRALPRLQAIARDAGATLALTSPQIIAIVQEFADQIPEFQRMRWIATEEIPSERASEWGEEEDINPEGLAYLQYTSGSTSSPNGVMISHRNLLHHCAYLQRANRYTPDSITVNWMPQFHDYGLVEGLLVPMFNGTPCYTMPPLSFVKRPVHWLAAMTRYKGTHSQAPNFAYDHCVHRVKPQDLAELDLRSWVSAGNAAEPINASVMESFMRLFEPCGFRPEAMCPAFGLAEATLLVSSSSPLELPTVRELDADALEQARILPASAASKSVRKIVGCGPLVCDTRVVIVNPESLKECGSDEIGEIWISDPSVAGGYWNKPEETKRTFHAQLADTGDGPFLRTGDLGFMMDGELFIAGRLKDLVIIRGSNFYPQDMEWTAQRSHPKLELADGAAFSLMVDGDERLVLVQEIKRKENQAQDFGPVAEAIIQAVAEDYDIRTYAVALIRGGSIPKTSSGKIQRRACRASFLDGSLNPLFVWKEGESRAPVGKTE